jgi:hypothetical protein
VAVVDSCGSAGLVCDTVDATCRKPAMGEQCNLEVGCDSTPAGLSCVTANLNGTEVDICLVRCLGNDSSSCPYGMSCTSNTCRPQVASNCTPGAPCSLGGQLPGQCLSDGTSSTCLATGEVRAPYMPCNPQALNSQPEGLCAPGLICRATALTLGGFADAGFCFPLCGESCPSGEHCVQPNDAFYRICRPGKACSLDADACAYGTVCLPDDLSTLGGGCIPIASNAVGLGASCSPRQSILPAISPCQEGACLPEDGGGDCCTPLCNRSSAGTPACASGSCDAIGLQSMATAVVGDCE